mmetsp:Transcript_20568/g.50076  ORF Transcript_20568/g.50076 Transcript_20568/m.50076 type:complete len:344 (+) Transcript_20568:3357-4388(+)
MRKNTKRRSADSCKSNTSSPLEPRRTCPRGLAARARPSTRPRREASRPGRPPRRAAPPPSQRRPHPGSEGGSTHSRQETDRRHPTSGDTSTRSSSSAPRWSPSTSMGLVRTRTMIRGLSRGCTPSSRGCRSWRPTTSPVSPPRPAQWGEMTRFRRMDPSGWVPTSEARGQISCRPRSGNKWRRPKKRSCSSMRSLSTTRPTCCRWGSTSTRSSWRPGRTRRVVAGSDGQRRAGTHQASGVCGCARSRHDCGRMYFRQRRSIQKRLSTVSDTYDVGTILYVCVCDLGLAPSIHRGCACRVQCAQMDGRCIHLSVCAWRGCHSGGPKDNKSTECSLGGGRGHCIA